MSSSTGSASTTTSCARRAPGEPRFVGLTPAGVQKHRAQPSDFDSRRMPMRFVGERARMRGRQRVRRRVSRPRFAERTGERGTPDAWRARPPSFRSAPHDGKRPRRTGAVLRPPEQEESPCLAIRRSQRAQDGIALDFWSAPDPCMARCALGPSEPRARFRRRRRIAIPATISSWAVLDAGKGEGRCGRALGLVGHPISKEAPASQTRACAAFTRSPCLECRLCRCERSLQPRSRETSAISARRRRILREPPPLSTEGMRSVAGEPLLERDRRAAPSRPRSASAGASSRRATRFSAPSGHPPRAHALP
jgi:hypothetical protein